MLFKLFNRKIFSQDYVYANANDEWKKKIVTEKSECQIQEYVIVDMGCGSS